MCTGVRSTLISEPDHGTEGTPAVCARIFAHIWRDADPEVH